MLDKMVEMVARAVLPSIVCPMLRDIAGENCSRLKMAIYMNDDLLEAYKKVDKESTWGYNNARKVASQYPNIADMITADLIMQWLEEQDMTDVADTINKTRGGRYWLERQVECFKRDLFVN